MNKETVRHENLRRLMSEFDELGEDTPDETLAMLLLEIKHSCLLAPGIMKGDEFFGFTAQLQVGEFGMVFTDMDELRKAFPDYGVEACANPFAAYRKHFLKSDYIGYIINAESEGFVLTREVFNMIDDMPELEFSAEESYSTRELKELKDSIDNADLENFIRNPKNTAMYEDLFELISSSTLLVLRLSEEDFSELFEDGIFSMRETGPLGHLHSERIGGRYATAFTSTSRMAAVDTPLNRYCQIVNFSQMTNLVLQDDMDGIIINPNEENVVLTRDVLLEYSSLIEYLCNDSRLNSGIFHLFPVEEADCA